MDDSQIDYVVEATKQQNNSTEWHDLLRIGRITSSTAHKVLRTSLRKPAQSPIKGICHPQRFDSSKVPSLTYGINNEPYDLIAFLNKVGPEPSKIPEVTIKTKFPHINYHIQKTGLHLNKKYPYLGASPDALIKCDWCGSGILEIKCPIT